MELSSPTFLAPLIVIGSLFAFVAFWAFVVTIVGRFSGWHRLAQDFEATRQPNGQTLGWKSMRFGFSGNYNGTVNITPSFEGLHLQTVLPFRVGHKPLLIPWEYITLGEPQSVLLGKSISAEIAPKYGGSATKISFYGQNVIDALQKHANSF